MPSRGRRFLSEEAAAWRSRRNHRLIAFGVAAAVALLVYLLVPPWLRGVARFVVAYDGGALALLFAFWQVVCGCDPEATRRRAALDDPGRNVVLIVVLSAVFVGLLAAIDILAHGPKMLNQTEKWVTYFIGIVAVTAGWFLVHTGYTFRYAHLYYSDADSAAVPGGLRFPGTSKPADIDFAYFSFSIGTTFAVSDVEVTDTEIRREVLWHSIIAFAYNSVIVAMVINVLAGIFSAPSGG